MSINLFHTISAFKIHHSYSCKLSVVHTKWRRNSLTIDMFKFTDVTASHVHPMYTGVISRVPCGIAKVSQTNRVEKPK